MTGPEDKDHPVDENDLQLDRLIRLLEGAAETGIPRPSDEALQAFLNGKATPKQEIEILRLLEISDEYRHEVAEVASDLARLRELEREQSSSEGTDEELPLHVLRQIEQLPTGKLRRIRGVATFLAAAALVVITVLVLMPSGPNFSLVAESIERSELISMQTRGSLPAVNRTFETQPEAALYGFRNVLEYSNSKFVPVPQVSSHATHESDFNRTLEITYPYTNVTYVYRADLSGDPDKSAPAAYFVLTLPNRNLYSLPVNSQEMAVAWSLGPTEWICVVLVHSTSEGFCATHAEVYPSR